MAIDLPMTDEAGIIIVGAGPAGVAAAAGLADAGVASLIIHSGPDPRPVLAGLRAEGRSAIARAQAPPGWSRFGAGDARRAPTVKRAYGLAAPYALAAGLVVAPDSDEPVSATPASGRGGYSLVWGAAMLPLRPADLAGWPEPLRDLSEWYRRILDRVPLSAHADHLESEFPLFSVHTTPHRLDPDIRALMARLGEGLPKGVVMGASRLAVDSDSGSLRQCRECGWCMSGCAWDSVFHADSLLESPPLTELVRVISDTLVLRVEEQSDHVVLHCRTTEGSMTAIRARRVLLGAGPVGSTALICASLDLQAAELRDNQAITVPIAIRHPRRASATPGVSLAQCFIEEFDETTSRSLAHWQVYPSGEEFRHILGVVAAQHHAPAAIGRFASAFVNPVHGFLPAERSGRVRVQPLEESGGLRIGVSASRDASVHIAVDESLRRLSRILRRGGTRVIGRLARTEAVGASYHLASSFPHAVTPVERESDLVGRPMGLDRVHLIDAAVLPPMPPQSPTLTVMANAYRIGSHVATIKDW